MGLTIKGQCIPDVSEPVEARGRTAGFSEAGARGLRRWRCGAGRRARGGAGITAGGGPEAPPPRGLRPPGREAPPLAFGGPGYPHSQGGIWSAESVSPRLCHLPQGHLARCSLAGKEDGRRWRVPECLSVICVHSAGGRGEGEGQGRRTCLLCAEPPLPSESPALDTSRGKAAWRWQSGLAMGMDVTREGSRLAEIQKAWKCRPRTGRFWEMSQECLDAWWDS